LRIFSRYRRPYRLEDLQFSETHLQDPLPTTAGAVVVLGRSTGVFARFKGVLGVRVRLAGDNVWLYKEMGVPVTLYVDDRDPFNGVKGDLAVTFGEHRETSGDHRCMAGDSAHRVTSGEPLMTDNGDRETSGDQRWPAGDSAQRVTSGEPFSVANGDRGEPFSVANGDRTTSGVVRAGENTLTPDTRIGESVYRSPGEPVLYRGEEVLYCRGFV